jgi:hypothetical protein
MMGIIYGVKGLKRCRADETFETRGLRHAASEW